MPVLDSGAAISFPVQQIRQSAGECDMLTRCRRTRPRAAFCTRGGAEFRGLPTWGPVGLRRIGTFFAYDSGKQSLSRVRIDFDGHRRYDSNRHRGEPDEQRASTC